MWNYNMNANQVRDTEYIYDKATEAVKLHVTAAQEDNVEVKKLLLELRWKDLLSSTHITNLRFIDNNDVLADEQ